jgi:CDP-diacylglycerol--glycerol-3-phosphate 3-phosphatidyltransferase
MASRQAQKSPPPAEPRSARWNAWLWAFTKPGKVRREDKADYDCTGMATRAVSAPLAQLPNALTLLRLAMIPVFVALLLAADDGHSWPAAIVFGVAGVTDQVDGFLARRWDVESAFGKIADPLADRLMIDAAVILLWHADRLPWVALAIPARDLLLIASTPFAIRHGYEFEVNLLGKAATWLLYASLAFVMVTSPDADWPLWIFWSGFALAVASLVVYALKARREVHT